MKISELRELLSRRQARHGDIDVVVTWEGTTHSIDPPDVYFSKSSDNRSLESHERGRLMIDADQQFYKKTFAADPTEGEDGT